MRPAVYRYNYGFSVDEMEREREGEKWTGRTRLSVRVDIRTNVWNFGSDGYVQTCTSACVLAFLYAEVGGIRVALSNIIRSE